MSTNDPTQTYLASIGAEVLRQQEEARQAAYDATGGGMTLQQQQALRNMELERAAARRKQDREIEAARERLAQSEKARQKLLDDEAKERAEMQEVSWKAAALSEWAAAGNSLLAFDLAWPDLLKQRRVQSLQDYEAARANLGAKAREAF